MTHSFPTRRSSGLWVGTTGEEDPEPVVLHVPEATPGSLDLLDEKVRGLDRAVRGSGAVVVQDLAAPAAQGLEEPGELGPGVGIGAPGDGRSEEHTSELQSLMRISYAVFCLK